jgi:tRNA threonylcarbamoyladenosine biosynthesis protein TsaE
MALRTHSFSLPGPDTTAGFAATLAPLLRGGDVILLEGPVGAGKTHFARSLIHARLGQAEDVPSPTFTLVQTYDTPGAEVWHADLYRLTSVHEIEELGLTDAFDSAICLVEWPDRLGDLAPSGALTLTLSTGVDEGARTAFLTWRDPRWEDRLKPWLS